MSDEASDAMPPAWSRNHRLAGLAASALSMERSCFYIQKWHVHFDAGALTFHRKLQASAVIATVVYHAANRP
jgi:hypothetical protein